MGNRFNLRNYLADIEEMFISEALEESGGNKTEAAKILGITRTLLVWKCKKYGFEVNEPSKKKQQKTHA